MTHIMIPENIAVTTENGFTAPISAWEQNIAVETATALSRVLPSSRIHIFARRRGVSRVFVVLNPSNFRYSTTNWDMKVSFHTLPSSLRELPNATVNQQHTAILRIPLVLIRFWQNRSARGPIRENCKRALKFATSPIGLDSVLLTEGSILDPCCEVWEQFR
jgi:hypothetical protein